MSGLKDTKALGRRIIAGGGELVGRDSKGHPKYKMPDGSTIVVPLTPSDHRCLKNTISRIRRAGIDIPSKGWR